MTVPEHVLRHIAGASSDPGVFGLSSTEWTAIAAIAQALAAFGAIALLITTLLSRRDAEAALREAERLASQTEALAEATRRSLTLAVQPVLEVRRDTTSGRLSFVNVGNGPLVEPAAVATEERSRLRTQTSDGTFVEVGALRVGQEAFLHLDGEHRDALTITGFTLVGEPVRWRIEPPDGDADAVFVPLSGEAPLAADVPRIDSNG
jgi:hypothetical protein